jgi:hypothetical protein
VGDEVTNPFELPPDPEPTITATFNSECPCCYGPIEVGDPIYLIDSEWCCEPCKELF